MIKLNEAEKKKFVEQRYQDFDFKTFNILKPDFNKTLYKELESYIELSDEKNLKEWYKEINIPNTKVEDFKERIFDTKSGKVLMGIRFLGLDINKPFVNVWSSFPIENELQKIIDFAKNSFKIFQPKHIRFWANPKNKLSKANQQHICQNYLVGSINEISKTEKPSNFESIELVQITNLDFYDWYLELYQEFHQENPNLRSYVALCSKGIFEDSIKQNLCYFIQYKNEIIGIIAAEKDEYFGVPSLYMNEIVISKKFKGKKLATAIQRKLINFNKNEFEFIWGNIDQKNIPSTKNAFRIGRKIISSEILLPI